MKIDRIRLDIDKKLAGVIPSVQWDNNTRYLHINVLNGTEAFNLSGYSVKVAGLKPDGTSFFNDVRVINAREGFIEVVLTEQMNAAAGSVRCELKLYNYQGVLSTQPFIIYVETSVTPKGIVSSNEFKALTDALIKVGSIDTKFETLTQAAIKQATEKEIQKQISLGNMSNLTIANGTITREKLAKGVLDLDHAIYDTNINKYIKSERIVGGYYRYTDGSWIGHGGYSSTKLIMCKGCTTAVSNTVGNIAFWNKEGKFLSGFNKLTADAVIPIPSNAIYITHSVPNENGDNFSLLFDKTTAIILGEQYKISEESITGSKIGVLNAFSEYIKGSINLFDKTKHEPGKYYETDGTIKQAGAYSSTGLIGVEGNTLYTKVRTGGKLTFWNGKGGFLSGTNDDSPTFTTPANAKYMRVSFETRNLNEVMVIKGMYNGGYVEYVESSLKSDILKLTPQNFANEEVKETIANIVEKPIQDILGDKIGILDAFDGYTKASINLFDKTRYIKDKYYHEDGSLRPLGGYSSSDLIKVEGGVLYTKLNMGGKITYWGSKGEFLSGLNSDATTFTPPSGAKYVRISFETSKIDKIMVVKGTYSGAYVPHQKSSLKSSILELTASNLDNDEVKETIANIIEKLMGSTGTPKIKMNPATPLDIKTYPAGANQPTHPKVLYFKNGWNGYKYWMAYTPYPGNNSFEENPCICYSNDGVNWSEDRISNPIIRSAHRGCWYSDVHLVYRPDTSTMELWVRYCSNGADGQTNGWEGMYRLKSRDGINWSEKEYLYHVIDTGWASVVSPAIIYEEGMYKIWYVYRRQCLKYFTSVDGTNWQFVRDIAINPEGGDPYKIWHMDIIKTHLGYEFVGCYQYNGEFDMQNFIYYAQSKDNSTFSKPKRILGCGYEGRFDYTELYRPCLCVVNDGTEHKYYNMYYGAQGKKANWAIGLVQASDIASLSGYVQQFE